jgi:uncharacterized membrane protein
MSTLVVVTYDDPHKGEEVRLKLQKLQSEYLLDLEDAVVAVKDAKGKVKLHQAINLTTGFWGALIGLIFLSPVFGFVVGATAGAVSGALTDIGITDSFMEELAGTMAPGSSTLFVLVRQAKPDKVLEELKGTGGVSQGATALGGVIWGLAAHHAGVVPTFLGAAAFGLVLMIVVHVVPAFGVSIDFTKGLSFEAAPATIFSQHLDPGRLPAPEDGPVSITGEFQVDPSRRSEFIKATRNARMIFLRNGASRWHLYEDLNQPNKFRMEVVVPSWKQHLLQHARLTKNEKEVIDKLRGLRIDPNRPEEWISLSVDREVLKNSGSSRITSKLQGQWLATCKSLVNREKNLFAGDFRGNFLRSRAWRKLCDSPQLRGTSSMTSSPGTARGTGRTGELQKIAR